MNFTLSFWGTPLSQELTGIHIISVYIIMFSWVLSTSMVKPCFIYIIIKHGVAILPICALQFHQIRNSMNQRWFDNFLICKWYICDIQITKSLFQYIRDKKKVKEMISPLMGTEDLHMFLCKRKKKSPIYGNQHWRRKNRQGISKRMPRVTTLEEYKSPGPGRFGRCHLGATERNLSKLL